MDESMETASSADEQTQPNTQWKSFWQLKQHSSIIWREWLWTENNTWPQNMIIILGLNNVLSRVLCVCVCDSNDGRHEVDSFCPRLVREKRTICFAIYLKFISTMHKIQLDCSDVHAGAISIGWIVLIVFFFFFLSHLRAQKHNASLKILIHGASFRMNSYKMTIN